MNPDRDAHRPHGVEEVELTTRDGVRLAADVHRPDGEPRAGIVLAHGLTGSRRGAGIVAQARSLAGRGLLVVTYDGRGHGASSGNSTVGVTEVHDLAAVVAHARRDTSTVVAVGASLGAVTILEYALTDPQLAGIVMVSIATSWGTMLTPRGLGATALTQARIGRAIARLGLGVRIEPDAGTGYWPTERIGEVGMPVAIVHGRDDPMVRPRAAVDLFDAAADPRHLEIADGMGHSFGAGGVPAIDRAVAWVLATHRERPQRAT